MEKQKIFHQNLKKIGRISIDKTSFSALGDHFKEYIKILYFPVGFSVTIDFKKYNIEQTSLFFVAPNQFLKISKTGKEPGQLIFFNRDFYCIQANDKELGCDGLLFNNTSGIPEVILPEEEISLIDSLLLQMEKEFVLRDGSQEEMIRTYLKQVLIISTRLWKKQHLPDNSVNQSNELELFRKFTIMVDTYYREKHTVADYAELLFISPKSITRKFHRMNLPKPKDIIKERIVLEAKRLLIYTSKQVKEIAFELGYEDPAYFNRIFLSKTGTSPNLFRKNFLQSNQ